MSVLQTTSNDVKTGKNGIAESIHFLLAFAESEFTDLKQKVEKWLEEEEKEGKLDTVHGLAVARCIGSALGLMSGDNWIDAQLDTTAFLIYDILKKTQEISNEPDLVKKAKMKDELKKEILETYFKSFEKIVEGNGGKFSKTLTWVDILFTGAVNVLEWYLGVKLVDSKFPFLMKLLKSVYDIPQIKKYIEDRTKSMTSNNKTEPLVLKKKSN